jgi:hypothetical protein
MVILLNDKSCSHITHKCGAGQNKEIIFNYPFTMKNLSVCSGNITGTLSLEPGCRSKAHQSLCCIGCFDMPTLNKTYLINITEARISNIESCFRSVGS